MKKTVAILFLSLVTSWAAVAEDVYYSVNFNQSFPEGFVLLDRDENPASGLSNINLSNGSWAIASYGRNLRAAMSSARATYDYSVEDWMILPLIHVKSSNAVLAWDALSIHYDFREDYKVMIWENRTKPVDFVEVYAVEEEEYTLRRHAISLAQYEGKDIRIAFVHTGRNKFLLGINNIKVGEWTDEYALVNHTDVSTTGGQDIEICGTLRNLSSAHSFNPVLRINGEEYKLNVEDAPAVTYQVGEEVPFSFTVPTPEEGALEYTIAVENGQWSASDIVYCSAFPRNILVEKFTGTWCGSCPEGSITMHKFEERYRNRIIMVEGHCSDILADEYYQAGLNYYNANLPSMVYDRMLSYKSQTAKDDGNIAQVMALPVTSQIESNVTYLADGRLRVESTVRFSQEYDNSGDRYRIGYAFIENVVHNNSKLYDQENTCQVSSCREYYFMPAKIPANLMYFHNVARGNETAFEGAPMSLPNETLLPGVDYHVVDTLDIPGSFEDERELSLVTVVISTRLKSVLSACKVSTEEIDWSAAVTAPTRQEADFDAVVAQDYVIVSGIEGYAQVTLYGVDGRVLAVGSGMDTIEIPVHNYNGVAVVAVTTPGETSYKKIVI